MHFQHCYQAGGLKRVMVFVLLTLLVCGEKEEHSLVGHSNQPASIAEKQQRQKQQQQYKHPRQLFDVNFSEKRKVPNASDPLHNR